MKQLCPKCNAWVDAARNGVLFTHKGKWNVFCPGGVRAIIPASLRAKVRLVWDNPNPQLTPPRKICLRIVGGTDYRGALDRVG